MYSADYTVPTATRYGVQATATLRGSREQHGSRTRALQKTCRGKLVGFLFGADFVYHRHIAIPRRDSQLAPVDPPTQPSEASHKRDRRGEAAPIEGGAAAPAWPLADPSGVPLEQGGGEGGPGAERDASMEGAVIDGREGGGEGDGAEGVAVREGVGHDGGEGGGERNLAERGVVRERNGADGVEGIGERQLCERGAACL